MATVTAHSAGTPIRRRRLGAARPSRLSVTLADLITAIQDVVGPEDDGLVVATLRHLLCRTLESDQLATAIRP
jgi:hypothetical protein